MVFLRQTQQDGAIRWLQTSKAPILSNGEVVGVLGMYELISATDAALRRKAAGETASPPAYKQ
ncbi:MAG: hypothetical protein AAFX94_07830 [Myxococcota bacterium]